MPVYGYCRISTPQQNIERQVRNIAAAYPAAHIVREVYTGTACRGRQELDKLLHVVQPGDAVLLDKMAEHNQQDAKALQLVNIIAALGHYWFSHGERTISPESTLPNSATSAVA